MGLSLINKYVSKDSQHYLELLQVLVSRNLKVRYRGSFLGIYWSLLNPLIMTSLYTAIFGATFAKYYDDSVVNYILAALTGLIVINFFSASTSQALGSVVGNGALLNKIRLHVSVFPVSMITANVVQLLMGAYPLLAIVALVKSHNLLNVFAIILPFVALVIFCIGVGFFVSALYVFFRDLPYFYEMVVIILSIGTPIFYPAAIVPTRIKPLLMINPLSPIIESLRQITLSGNHPNLMMVASALFSSTIFAVLGWAYFHRSRSQFMDLL